MTVRSLFNGYRPPRDVSGTLKYVATPTCRDCRGSTIGEHGEQCRTCKGAGFLTYRGGQGVGRAMEARR